ncbi:HK97 family phage prohead protease [uncultured Bacteroides sp.]|uniref:HK97 family phage prohead protease n=1 Tax=uncultured Bacteroides sp. TaxID=162156 RepID=UPI002AA684E7|nr:HK97 family phage prohead protease [uncultured Bacteroides sp.]
MEKEIRKIQLRANNSDNRTIDGYASVFASLSEDLGGFRELVDKNAFAGVIEKSDVFALLNHDSKRGILARSKNGTGTLSLSIDDTGLKYSFESPATALGDEAIEMIKRGDIDSSSFAFTIESDKWDKQADGTYIRTILKFGQLFDISPVYQPAYSETTACKRFLEIQEENKEIPTEIVEQEIKESKDKVIEEQTIEVAEESTEQVEEQPIESTEQVIEENKQPVEPTEQVIEENKQPVEPIEQLIESTDEERNNEKNDVQSEKRELNIEENKIIKNKEKRQMENFKLISAINSIASKRGLTDEQKEFSNLGAQEVRNIGQSIAGDIYIPMSEHRDVIGATSAGFGMENIGETKNSLTTALQPNLVLMDAGAKFITGLINDFSLPSYAGTSSLWAGEKASATDGAGAFSEQIMRPKRLTTYVDVSLQFLAQDSNSANEQLIESLRNSISQKLESTILGNVTGATMPNGLFAAGANTISGVTYANIVNLESQLEDKNVNDYSFIISNKAKSILKSTVRNQMSFIYDNKEVDACPAYVTANVYNKGIVVADFKNLWIGQWGPVVLTIDEKSHMTEGVVRIIINGFYDAAWIRPAYVVAQLA